MNQYDYVLPSELVTLLTDWYQESARDLPWRRTADPYAVWVSEIMLQQTRVETVIPYYLRFMDALPDVRALAEAPEDRLLKLWEGLGYYSRVRNLQKAARILVTDFGGVLPADYKSLLSLPGIGEYTAGAIASEAFGLPVPAVDGNVLRILSRILAFEGNIAETKTKKYFTGLLREVYPEQGAGIFTQSLMELGAVVCVPNGAPRCGQCPVSAVCCAYGSGNTERYPIKSVKKNRREIKRTVFVLLCEDRIAINRREVSGVLSGLWELPGAETALSPEAARQLLEGRGIGWTELTELPSTKHIFTHITWHMTCYLVRCTELAEGFIWVSREELSRDYMLPSAYLKILKRAGI